MGAEGRWCGGEALAAKNHLVGEVHGLGVEAGRQLGAIDNQQAALRGEDAADLGEGRGLKEKRRRERGHKDRPGAVSEGQGLGAGA